MRNRVKVRDDDNGFEFEKITDDNTTNDFRLCTESKLTGVMEILFLLLN